MLVLGHVERSLLFFIAIASVLAGCELQENTIGHGELTLTAEMNVWSKRYENTNSYVAVSVDGTVGYVTFCTTELECGNISPGRYAIENCQKRSNKECFIYMIDGQVVWDLNKPSSISDSMRRPTPSRLSAAELCFRALHKENPNAWNSLEEAQAYVVEAKLRQFTPKKCQAYGLDEIFYCKLPSGVLSWMKRSDCYDQGGHDTS